MPLGYVHHLFSNLSDGAYAQAWSFGFLGASVLNTTISVFPTDGFSSGTRYSHVTGKIEVEEVLPYIAM